MRHRYFIHQTDLRRLVGRAAAVAKRHAREVVGLLIDNGFFLELVECRNKSRRAGSFSFYYVDIRSKVAAAERLGHEVVGTFHSHPAGLAKPGEGDVTNAVDNSLMLIIDCTGREAALWRIKNGKTRKMLLQEIVVRQIQNP
jgi:proteasome lid subunit RPN8/RPN11